MAYAAMNFEHLLGTEGFSDQMLKNHFTLYQGYVTNTNKLADALSAMAKEGKTVIPEYAELKRRFGWEFNGMRLHELYFGNMKKGGSQPNSELQEKVVADFGSYENWEKDFRATGAMRGIGWVVLYYDSTQSRLFNCWINEHDAGHLAGTVPLLVMDVFEHAFMLDYGLKRADYINAFFKSIDWDVVSQRINAGG
ncbi:MAG: Fe-Mn family superoxide dismutase [Candidatus ainarchaeum sp.]|nr:Fe-Mn family superoxide dismutase [Candidatus ainarchaeum sp.]